MANIYTKVDSCKGGWRWSVLLDDEVRHTGTTPTKLESLERAEEMFIKLTDERDRDKAGELPNPSFGHGVGGGRHIIRSGKERS